MYYSKNSSPTLTLPQNYSGNAFSREGKEQAEKAPENNAYIEETSPKEKIENQEQEATKKASASALPSLFSSISVEDLLLLGLIFVIHQDNPNDSTLLLLLILLLAK